MIWGGYLIIVFYLLALVFGLGTLLKHFFGVEVSRKAIHILTFGLFPIYHFFIGPGYHLIILCGAFLLFAALSYWLRFAKTMERETRGTPGTIYYAVALLALSVLVQFFPDLYPYFGLAFLMLAFGDGLAGLLGFCIKGPKIYKEKTIVGSLSCFVSCFGLGILYCWIYVGYIPFLALLALGLVAAVVELVDYGLDNLVLPWTVFALTCVLFPGNDAALIATFIFAGLFLLIHLPKLMTYYGALFSSLIGAMVYYCGSYPCLLFFAGMYLLYFVVHLIKKKRKVEDDGVVEKGHRKDGWQVLANGFFCLVAAALNLITKSPIFTVIMMSGCVALFTDTMASDLGTFSKTKPFDIFHGRYVDNGVSGGITPIGTLGSAAFALAAGFGLSWMLGYPVYFGAIVAGIAIFSCFVDTALGSLLQVKYACVSCGKTTERKIHCGMPTEKKSGVRFMNNDLVNFLSTGCAFALGFLLFLL